MPKGVLLPVSSAIDSFRMRELREVSDFERYREQIDLLTVEGPPGSRYVTGFCCSRRCLELALRLRYEIFNLELGEGLATSALTGLDEDPFDAQMTHLVLVERTTGRVVGTYRIQTMAKAELSSLGSYSAQEFCLEKMRPLFARATECGRACLSPEHRNARALLQLWLGLGAYLNLYDQRYLFGCCSITSTDPAVGWWALETLRRQGSVDEELLVEARPDFACRPSDPAARHSAAPSSRAEDFPLPKLFKIYLRLGAKVLSEPAMDRAFGTIDFLVMLDAQGVTLSSLRVVV